MHAVECACTDCGCDESHDDFFTLCLSRQEDMRFDSTILAVTRPTASGGVSSLLVVLVSSCTCVLPEGQRGA